MSPVFDLSSKLIEILWREFIEPPLRKRLNARAQARLLETDPTLSTLDKRIQQIERASSSLQDATEAVRELQEIAKSNKAEVEAVLATLAQVKTEKQTAEQELAALRALAEVDVEAFRRVAGVPTQLQIAKERFRERAYGFLLGVLASVVASALWWLLTKYIPALRA
jgi:ABC-type transporter Mla subunit MlaD